MKRYMSMILLTVLIISLSLSLVQSQPFILDPIQVQTDVFSNGTTAIIRLVTYPYSILNGPIENWDDYLARIEFEPDLVGSTLYLLNSSGFYYLNETIFPAEVQVVNATFSCDWYLWGIDDIHNVLYAYRINTSRMCAVRVSDVPHSGHLLPVLFPTVKNGSVEFSGSNFSFSVPKKLLDRYVLDWIQPYLRAVPAENGYVVYLPEWGLMGFNGTFVLMPDPDNHTIQWEQIPPVAMYYNGSSLTPLAFPESGVPVHGLSPVSVRLNPCFNTSWGQFLPDVPSDERWRAIVASSLSILPRITSKGIQIDVSVDQYRNPFPLPPSPKFSDYFSGLSWSGSKDFCYVLKGNEITISSQCELDKSLRPYYFDGFLDNGSVRFVEGVPHLPTVYIPLRTLMKLVPTKECVRYLYIYRLGRGLLVLYPFPRAVYFNGTYHFFPSEYEDYNLTLRELPPLVGYIADNGTVYEYPILQSEFDKNGNLYYVLLRGSAPIKRIPEGKPNVSTTIPSGAETTETSSTSRGEVCGPALIVLLAVLPLLRKRL